MVGRTSVNGETATPRKRKRGKNDVQRKSRKKHRSKSKDRRASSNTHVDEIENEQEGEPRGETQGVQNGNESQVAASFWKISNPMGGRMLDIDPIFSPDEQHLVITFNLSIQVFTTADSLLVRRIPLPLLPLNHEPKSYAHIVASVLSMACSNFVWVACSDGRIWHIDWTAGTGNEKPFVTKSRIVDMAVQLVNLGKSTDDVLLILGPKVLSAYDREALSRGNGKKLHFFGGTSRKLGATRHGQVLVAADEHNVHIGSLKGKPDNLVSLDSLEYRFFSFQPRDLVICLDLRYTTEAGRADGQARWVVDLAIGCARGPIYVYNDVLAAMPTGSKAPLGALKPRKYHWHRKAVHSFKWSRDGNYLVSGGSEDTLVLWQLDTGKCEFLPHLSASIENIVVSPRGSSYAVHLDDNSVMVLSTAEMKPTFYVSGLQALALNNQPSKDSLVRRVWTGIEEFSSPIAATTNPKTPSQMLLCVANGQTAALGDGHAAAPLVQAFDVSSFRSLYKRAVARTIVSEARITTQGHPILEPRTTNVAYSHNGKWLATADEWEPPARDLEPIMDGICKTQDACRERREVYLKFWASDSESGSLELVTRVDEAHRTAKTHRILDISSDPKRSRFATIGGDGNVKLWTAKLRKKDGLVATGLDGQPLRTWSCSQCIVLGETAPDDDDESSTASTSGAICFSEDASIIFAAFRGPCEALVYVIDSESGDIRARLRGLIRGGIRSVKAVASCLVTLSELLTVYDVVADQLRYGFSLPDSLGPAFRMTLLAANQTSRSFAVAVPVQRHGAELRRGASSELTVFSIDDATPQLTQVIPWLITSVLPATSSTGFIVVDAAAQIWSVTEGPASALFLQPLAELDLDNEVVEDADRVVNGGVEDVLSDEEMQGEEGNDEMVVEDQVVEAQEAAYRAVVAPQRLADIFNVAPAYAMAPMEDVFYQVVSLFEAKPASSVAS